MIRLKVYKKNEQSINLEDSSISLNELDNFFESLGPNIPSGTEIQFSLTNSKGVTEDYKIENVSGPQLTLNGKAIEQKSFFDLIKKATHLLLDSNVLKSRIISVINFDSAEIQKKISSLEIPLDVDLDANKQLVEKELEELKAKIESSLKPEQKDKYARVKEINSRLEDIQSQIDFYQNEKKLKEEINAKIKKLNTEKEAMAQMLQSVELLIKNREELVTKLSAYSDAQSIDIKELKNKKVSYLNTKLFSNKPPVSSILDEEESVTKSKFSISFNTTVILTLINIGVVLVAFLYSYSIAVLLIGIITTLILVGLYVASRFFKDSLEDIEPKEGDKEFIKEEKRIIVAEPEDPNTQLFINSAWANALKNELEVLDSNIQRNLNGKTYQALKEDQLRNEEAVNTENKKIEELNGKTISSDEYYKKRRESDILKIEKENLEFGLKVDPGLVTQEADLKAKKAEIDSQIEYSKKVRDSFPVFLSGNVNKDQISALKQNLPNQLVLVIAI